MGDMSLVQGVDLSEGGSGDGFQVVRDEGAGSGNKGEVDKETVGV